jgi:GTPase SAR1 family protein
MNTYKIVVLGTSGSGKTVFLASLYNQLLAQRDDFGFYLEINTRQKRELVEKYAQIANLQQEWPASTDRSQHTSWTFACCVEDEKQQIHRVISFEYLDYAGETITDPLSEQGTEELDKAIEEADVLLCLLDGQKVLALMQKQDIGYQLLQRDLPNIIPYLQKTTKPIHFVLTKWDLFLTDEYYNARTTSLKASINRLMAGSCCP